MTTVIDIISLRRPDLRYVSPAICEAIFSGTGHPVIVLDPIAHLVGPTGLVRGGIGRSFLTWNSYPGAVCFSLYVAIEPDNPDSPYNLLSECVPIGSIGVCSPAWFKVSAVTSEGETALSDPIFSAGGGYTIVPLPTFPHTICYNLYINPNVDNPNDQYFLYWECLPVEAGGGFEICNPGCYKVGAITPDGQSDLSDPDCVPDDDLGHYEEVYNAEQTADCPPGYSGDSVTVNARTYSQSIFFPPGTTPEQRDAQVADTQAMLDLQALEAATAQLECTPVPPPSCPDWTTLVWQAPVITPSEPGPGVSTASGLGANWSEESSAPAFPDDAAQHQVVVLTGSLTYTGPECESKVHVVTNVLLGGHLAIIQVKVDGSEVLNNTNPSLTGTYDIPFTIPASVGALIEVVLTQIVGDTEFTVSISHTVMTGTFSSL